MSAPRKGTRGTYETGVGLIGFVVKEVEGNLCYVDYDNGEKGPFIWRFGDRLNVLHDWPGKPALPKAAADAGEAT